MAKHILLTFLSDVKKNRRDRKTRPNLVCKSIFKDIGDTYTTNESAVQYLLKYGWKGESLQLDKIFAFASNTVYRNPVGALCEGFHFPDTSIDENGNSLTHFAYFIKRISGFVDVNTCIPKNGADTAFEETVINYNEESSDITDTMGAVIGMAGKIQLYLRSVKETNPDETVVLHADMTGGFRHAAMMMIAVMRLIQFAGISIGHVLYSNWTPVAGDSEYNGEGAVQEVGEIYGMYDLVAGAAEFTNFGSVHSFMDYFSARVQSESLNQLLDAMQRFDAAIKISRRREFEIAVHELKEKLANFQDNVKRWTSECKAAQNPSALNDLLMYSLNNRIQQEYRELFDDDVDDLVFVEWCLKHGYMQQALTLYTESFPDFIEENNFITITEKGKKLIDETKSEDDQRDPLFYLLAECVPEEMPVLWLPEEQLNSINNTVKEYLMLLNNLAKVQESIKRNQCKSQVSVEDLSRDIEIYEEKIANLLQADCKRFKPIYADDKRQILECLKVIRNLRTKGFRNYLNNMSENEMERIQGLTSFGKNDIDSSEENETIVRELRSAVKELGIIKNCLPKLLNRDKIQWDRKFKRCSKVEMLLYCRDIEIEKAKPEQILTVLDSYFMIRAIRNDMAHAKLKNTDVKDYKIQEIRNIVKTAIKDIRSIQNQVRTGEKD